MVVLGHALTTKAKDFIKEKEGLVGVIDFRDISQYPIPLTRQMDGAHDFDGAKHVVWLNPNREDFEPVLMHEVMHAVLGHQGYPETARPAALGTDPQTYAIGSLLGSVVLDTIIDDILKESDLAEFDRQPAIQSRYAEAHRDSQRGRLTPYGYPFCLWSLRTFHLLVDHTNTQDQRDYLSNYIEEKFPEAFKVGRNLSRDINLNANTTPSEALPAMVKIRDTLKLHERVYIVAHNGKSY